MHDERKLTMIRPRRVMLLAGSLLLTAAVVAGPATSAAAAPAGSGYGWIRLAHLSPNTPAVDVYLYSYGRPDAMIVLHHVSYGTVSPYQKVTNGEYTVAMRAAGAAPSTKPVLSCNLTVHPGHAYTVAGMGAEKELRLQVLQDRLSTPKGRALVRVIQASLREHRVTVRAGHRTLARDLAFASVTGYTAAPPGSWPVHAAGGAETWSGTVPLAAGSIRTLVVLDSASGLAVTSLMDAAGSGAMPAGGAATGLGGTAPRPASSPVPWLAGLAAGLLAAAAAAVRLRRSRAVARHAR